MQKAAWKYYIHYYKDQLFKLVLSVSLSAGQTVFILPLVFLVKYIFDELIPAGNYKALIWAGLILLALNFASYALSLWSRHLGLKTTKKVIAEIREHILLRFFRLSRAFMTKAKVGELHASIVQDTQRLDVMSNALISQFLPQLFIVLILSLILLYLNWVLFLIMMTIIPLLYLVKRFLRKKQIEKIKVYHRSFEGFSKGIMFILQKMDLIRIQSAEQTEIDHQKVHINETYSTSYSMAWLNSAYMLIQKGMAAIVGILILVAGGVAVTNNSMTIGELLSFYVAAARMGSSMQLIFSSIPAIIEGNQSLLTLYEFLNIQEDQPYTGKKNISFKGSISFNSVEFSYGDKRVLNSVDCSIKPGSIIAILGSNGVGKSTMVNLILGFYKPQKGFLKADDTLFEDLDIVNFREQIGVVLQNPILLPGTIKENITYGTVNRTKEDVARACEISTANEFIDKLPLGMNSHMGDNGALFSGGQIQRILLARAILSEPKLLILDEPTNHLDRQSIDLLLRNIVKLDFQPSIVLITQDHDLANSADYIYVLNEDGQLINK